MKSPLHVEITKKKGGEISFLFTKRINANKGTFPSHYNAFPERYKRKLGDTPSMTLSEAGVIALERSKAIEHLQGVSHRDKSGRTNSTKDLVSAAKTWIWFNDIENLSEIRAESTRPTAAGDKAGNTIAVLVEAVKSFYRIDSAGYTHTTTYTPFGDYLINTLNSGSVNHLYSEAVDIWAKQTNRGHLPSTSKTIRDANRFVKSFNDFIGDRPIEQITRTNVASYITYRCKSVKTTSVDREIHTLRAVWNKAADALDIKSRNPFERQAIYGLGMDAVRRVTPTTQEHLELIKNLNDHSRKYVSYVVPMLAIIGLTGMRLSEVWGIKTDDFDREKSILQIQPNESRRLKTLQSERPFPVLPELDEWLDIYFGMTRPSSANSASAATSKFLKENGFKLTAHCLRHGFKQRLTEVGAPENLIEELMGWSSQSMIRHYGLNAITNQKKTSVQMAYKIIINKSDSDVTPNKILLDQLKENTLIYDTNIRNTYKNQQVRYEFNNTGRNMASRPMDSFIA